MAGLRKKAGRSGGQAAVKIPTALKVGDPVMVLGGGNSKKQKLYRGKVGKILRLLPKSGRVIVEGVNLTKRHRRARSAGESSGIIEREGSVHISNVMYYSEERKRPLRVRYQQSVDGRKIRGIVDPKTRKFEAIDA